MSRIKLIVIHRNPLEGKVDLHSSLQRLQKNEAAKNTDILINSAKMNRKIYVSLIAQIQNGEPGNICAAIQTLWKLLRKSYGDDVESLCYGCIEFATCLMYFSDGWKHRPETLSLCYTQFVERISECVSPMETYACLSGFIEDSVDIMNQFVDGNTLIAKAKRLINECILEGTKVNLDVIAKKVYLSPAYLSRLFKKTEQVNFVDYILQQRMKKAKLLLSSTDDTIVNIASKCGYSETNSFRRLFRKKVGLSPSKYREINRNE